MTYRIEIKLADVIGPDLENLSGEIETAVVQHREWIDIDQLLADRQAIALIWDADMLLSHYPHLTREQAWEVLQGCDRAYHAETGLTWDDVNEAVFEMHPDAGDADRHAERVSRCDRALQTYCDSDAKANLVDLLSDARHWCDRQEMNFGELDRVAYQHYLAERTGKE